VALEVRTTVLQEGSAGPTFTDVPNASGSSVKRGARVTAAEAGGPGSHRNSSLSWHEIRTPMNGCVGAVGY